MTEATTPTLPFEDFPKDLVCPFCDTGRVFKNSNGLRGHAHAKHGIKWEKTPWDELSQASKDLINRGFSPEGLAKLEKLLPHHMLGIAMVELQGMSFEEAAKNLGRNTSAEKLKKASGSPAGLAYQQWLQERFDKPQEVARAVLHAQAADASISFLAALQWAKDAHDYDAVHRMTKDLLKAAQVLDPEPGEGGNIIHVHIGEGKSLDMPTIETSWEEVLKEEDDEDYY